MSASIIDISHDFFEQIVKPILEKKFPEETSQTVFGVFGLGSEALGLDDEHSRDHHWGLRIDALMPEDVFTNKREEILATLADNLPDTFQGYEMGEGIVASAGIAPDILSGFLSRTIGIDHPPESHQEWLNLPEEDIIHIINGEVWHDPVGQFTKIRQSLQEYYPEPVRLRRMAHHCRYYSGMGTYALKRALLRDNKLFAATAFGKSIRWGIQLAYMLDKQYYPYDKWLYDLFKRLPRMYDRLGPIVDEAVKLSSSWDRKLELLDQMSDVLDQAMVEDSLIEAHPKFVGSDSSGYRLMEHAYKELLGKVPDDLMPVI
ncbi:MAG: DUF4037 domain-containing protein, partial [Chloroflexi bacterium]|nr:DUF4037 domain-containing protein [Chloroflexota bacterium]